MEIELPLYMAKYERYREDTVQNRWRSCKCLFNPPLNYINE